MCAMHQKNMLAIVEHIVLLSLLNIIQNIKLMQIPKMEKIHNYCRNKVIIAIYDAIKEITCFTVFVTFFTVS